MTWFKVDDKFWSHPKALHLSSTALGIWVRCGAYCADHLTDGTIEDRTVAAICPDPRPVVAKAIHELVQAGLWEPRDGAWQYHDWPDHQPSREQVEADRKAGAERQRKSRERRRRDAQLAAEATPTLRAVTRESHVTNAVTNA